MRNIVSIISKNFKLLLRSKTSALIIVLGPLLVIFLVGIAFDNMDQYTLNIGVYSDSYSELTESLILKLQDNDFRVQKFDSIEYCIDKIKQETVHTCIEFPPGFTISKGDVNDLILHVDYSKMNLVFMVLDTLSSSIEEQSSEISMDLTSVLLDKLESVKVQIYNLNPSLDDLKSQNEQLLLELGKLKQDVLSVKVKDLKDTSTGIKTDLLTKVNSARTQITVVKTSIDSILDGTNVSNYTQTTLIGKIDLIDTYLYNMYSILEDPNDLTESDWTRVMKIIDSIEKDFSSIQKTITQLEQKGTENSRKIDQIKSSLSSIHTEIESIKITNATTIVSPINTEIKPVVAEKSYLNYLFPALIILVVMFISILLSTTLVMMEKHSPAYFRTFLTPTRTLTFIISTYLTNIILVFIQVAIILGISIYFFKSQIFGGLLPALGVLFLTTTLFTFIGMAIGYLFTSEETATLAAISTGSVLLFISNVILPLESMPEYIAKIAQFNPFVIGESLFRKTILFNMEFGVLQKEILTLVMYSVGLFALIWGFHVLSKKHLFHKVTIHKSKEEKPKKKAK